jgi:hypothetical protein
LLSSFSLSSTCILEAAEFTGVGGVLELSLLKAINEAVTSSSEERKNSGCNRRFGALPHDGCRDESFFFVVMN